MPSFMLSVHEKREHNPCLVVCHLHNKFLSRAKVYEHAYHFMEYFWPIKWRRKLIHSKKYKLFCEK